ncbi:MAG: DUF302 domain-containing protein [Methylococcaceae bacterium]
MFFRTYLLPVLTIIITAIFSFSVLAETDNTTEYGINTIILEDKSDVASAVAELTAGLEQQGFTIPLIVNHSAAAESVDLDLAPNQVIFARPPKLLEKRLLRKSNTIGLDLPIKFLVFEDDDGNIKLSINTLGYLIDRHKIHIKDLVLKLTTKLITQFSAMDNEESGLITVQSSLSTKDTAQTLQNAISANPSVRIPLILEYGDKNANRKHERYKKSFPILIVFGNPNVGTPLMQSDPRIGIDLPLKFLVWEDQQGQVNITYNDPLFIVARVNLQGQHKRLEAIAAVLNNLALTASEEDL